MAETWSLPTPSMEQLRVDDATSVLLVIAEHNSLRTTVQRWRNTPAGKLSYKYED